MLRTITTQISGPWSPVICLVLLGTLLVSTLGASRCQAEALKNNASTEDDESAQPRVGREIKVFRLQSHQGKVYSLADYKDQVVVVAFLGAECPMAKLYATRLTEMAKEFSTRRVAFIGINSNRQDSLREIASFAQRHNINFPILRDVKNMVADHFGAVRTPEVFVIDRNRIVRYWGRIDDQYGYADGVGYQRPAPTREDLAVAIREVVADREVSVPETMALGCLIGRYKEPDPNATVTYSNQVARIFQKNCVECHRAGRIGPFEMDDYEDLAGWGDMIREVVEDERMPPWHASPQHGQFANSIRLSDADKQAIYDWVDAGCPEGDPAELPDPVQFTDGWSIGEPDQIVYMSDRSVPIPAEGVIDYYHFVVDPGWKEDVWIKAAEAKPGSYETVHHVLVFIQEPSGPRNVAGNLRRTSAPARQNNRGRGGNQAASGAGGELGIGSGGLIAGYAPGMNPIFASESGEIAMLVKAGSKLLFQLHYTPNGTRQLDRSYVGFKFAKPEEVKLQARSAVLANAFFSIPPRARNYQARASTTFRGDAMIACMTPHMHTRGKSFRYELNYPDGRNEILLDIPSYDFNWQTSYHLQDPKPVPAGTELVCTAIWDNSEDNLSNPNPNIEVTWGEQTWNEMMLGFYVEVFPKGKPPRQGGILDSFSPKDIFETLDKNKDGKLTKDELPPDFAKQAEMADLNRDGVITIEEIELISKLMKSQ